MKYIIIDLRKKTALYGILNLTLLFDSEDEANNIGAQFFHDPAHFVVIGITIKRV